MHLRLLLQLTDDAQRAALTKQCSEDDNEVSVRDTALFTLLVRRMLNLRMIGDVVVTPARLVATIGMCWGMLAIEVTIAIIDERSRIELRHD